MATCRVLALAAGAALLVAWPVAAQDFSGTWQGRIRCEAAGTIGALNAPITLTVAGGQARYERPLVDPRDVSKVIATEIATGPVAADGSVKLTGTVGGTGWRQDSSWTGRMARPSTTLGGAITTFSRQNNAGVERRCTLTASPAG